MKHSPVSLNAHQERAVKTPGHCTIVACPGSGKTRVIAERSAYLLSNHDKGRLCAVTFTRDSAAELKERILSACGKENARRLAVGTFHSIALAQLKRAGLAYRLISDGERFTAIKRCRDQYAPEIAIEEVVEEIDKAKSRLTGYVFPDQRIEDVFNCYTEVMRADKAFDFADIMLLAVEHMKYGSLQPLPIRWLLVDEAQDMDEVQLEWVLLHGKSGVEITLVGDDDQSLYGFRSALGYDGICRVTETFSSALITLPVNYRCAKNILEHAARLIYHNKNRADKRIEPNRTDEGEIAVIRASDRWDEAMKCLETIRKNGKPSQWAILARTNAILDKIEVVLTAGEIPYRRFGGKSVWSTSIGAVFVGLLRSVCDGSLIGVANSLTFAGVAADTVHSMMLQQSGAIPDRLNVVAGNSGRKEDRETILSLSQSFAAWQDQAKLERYSLVIHGVAAWIKSYCKPELQDMLTHMESALAKISGSLARRLAVIGMADAGQKSDGYGGVSLMTLHASKGLEFDYVWIIGCEEGNIPHLESFEEEERRLFYVGMTRARHKLFMSTALEEGLETRFFHEAGLR